MKPMRLTLAAMAIVALLAACASSPESPGTVDPADADVTITSVDMEFDQTTVTVAAGEPFTLALVNEDAMPHNVAIYTDSSASDQLFAGELVTQDTIVYDVPALEPGAYFVRCDLHPEMTGTLVVEG
ncbi:MAG: cupredoxin domain-containing protein [Candidatus Limnocylindria bacterium]